MYELASHYCADQQNSAKDLIDFRSTYQSHFYSSQLTIAIRESLHDLIDIIMDGFNTISTSLQPRINCYNSRIASITDSKLKVNILDHHHHHNDLWKVYDRSVEIDCYGEHDLIAAMIEYIKATVVHDQFPNVTWEFMSGDDRRSQDVQIAQSKPIFNEFYPWLDDVNAYFDRYMASESSILVLLGETGTAKTSFIRSLIWHAQLNTMLTYEESLLGSDSLFVDFIVDDSADLLVVEDADLLLTDREHDGNKIMAKFLNVSDGLARIGRKKIIFTANITEASRIDPAMLRPGRCFDCQVFRRLTHPETVLAAKVAGIVLPKTERSYTLAEMFALTRNEKRLDIAKSIGFKGR
jgi:hypothetical protein